MARAVRVKAEVVAEDETESGRRAILNFGHTVGYALEAASGYGLLHGEAVALGMLAALALGGHAGVSPPALVTGPRPPGAPLDLPVDLALRLSAEVLARVSVDKKRRGGAIKFVLLPRPGGRPCSSTSPPDDIAATFWRIPRSPGLDPSIPNEYKPQVDHRERYIPRKHSEARLTSSTARHRGRAHGVRRHPARLVPPRSGFGDSLPDIQTLSAEFAHLVSQARRTVQSLDAGRAGRGHDPHRHGDARRHRHHPEYFLACAMLPTAPRQGSLSVTPRGAPALRADL